MHAILHAKSLARAGIQFIDQQRYHDEMERYKYSNPLSTLLSPLTSVDVPNLEIGTTRCTQRGNMKVNEPIIRIDAAQGRGLLELYMTVDEMVAFRNQINRTILDYYAAAGQHLLHIFEEENQKMAEWL